MPVGKEWSRFLVHAARVKNLSFSHTLPPKDHLRTLRMALPSPSSPFPNLNRLTLPRVIPLDTTAFIPVLLGPTLHEFSVLVNNADVTCSLLGFLSHQCPELRSLTVRHWDADSLAILPRFQKLQSLVCVSPLLSPTAVSFFALSPFLTSLSISAPRTIPQNLESTETFMHLATLSISSIQDLLLANALLCLVPRQRLCSLSLSFHEAEPISHASHVTALVKTISEFRALTELVIYGDGIAQDSIPRWDLEPLQRLSSLKKLDISLPGYQWSREALRRTFGLSWPELKSISLENPASAPSSIEILGDATLYLPKLSRLKMPIDASIIPEYPVPMGRSTKPVWLLLDDCPITEESWPHIAAYIAASYPKAIVSTIMLPEPEADPDDENQHRWWWDVARMVPIMAMVGQTERSLINEGIVDIRPVF